MECREGVVVWKVRIFCCLLLFVFEFIFFGVEGVVVVFFSLVWSELEFEVGLEFEWELGFVGSGEFGFR